MTTQKCLCNLKVPSYIILMMKNNNLITSYLPNWNSLNPSSMTTPEQHSASFDLTLLCCEQIKAL